MNKDDKFMLIDATMEIVVGGFGNDAGNIDLAKLDKEQVKQMIIEDNSKEDDIRLVLSLLDTINNQQEKLDKINEYVKSEKENYMNSCGLKSTTNTEGLLISSAVRTCNDIQKIIKGGSNE